MKYLRLDKHENLGFDRKLALAIVRRITPDMLSVYPEYVSFYERLSRWLGCPQETLLITAGSDGAIKLAFEAFLEEGDRYLILNPSFAMFEIYGALCGATAVKVDFPPDLSFPLEEVLDRMDGSVKLVAIASPNNPTGGILESAGFRAIVRKAQQHGTLVLIDEAYYYFTRHTVFSRVLKHDNVLLTRTFSKACGLAALRLGFAHGAPFLIDNLRKCQPMFDVTGVSLLAASVVIENDHLIWKYARTVQKSKDYLYRALPRMGVKVHKGHGNSIMVDVGPRCAHVAEALKRRGILVGAGIPVPALANCLKVTVGPPKLMARFARDLRSALREVS